MEFTKRKTITNYIFFILIYFILFSIVVFFEFSRKDKVIESSTMYQWDSNWSVSIDNRIFEPANLTDFAFPPLNKGEGLVLRNVIPETKFEYPVIVIQANYATINVFINDELTYSYGNQLYQEGKLTGCGFHYIPLDSLDDITESTVEIQIISTENNAMSSLFPIYISPALNAKFDIIQRSPFTFYSCLFLVFIGLALCVVSLGGFAFKKRYYSLLALSQFSFWTGLGVLCNNGFFQFFSYNLPFNSVIEYLSLYLMPLSFISLFYLDIAKAYKEKRFTRIYAAVYVAFIIIAFILSLTNVIHFPGTLFLFQIIACVGLFYSLFVSIRRLSSEGISHAIIATGFIVLLLFAGLDIARYVIQKFFYSTQPMFYCSLLTVGAIIFIIASIVNFVSYMENQTEKVNLTKKDSLTGLYTKEAFLATSHSITSSNIDYSVISFKLSNLKQINESKGFLEGNKALQEYASVLNKVFSYYGVVARTGNATFMVIVPDCFEGKVKHLLEVFNKLIDNKNSKDLKIESKTSYITSFEDNVVLEDSSKDALSLVLNKD